MAVVVITTIGGKDSNSYVSVAEADAYFAKRLNADAWEAAPEDSRAKALILATSYIDQIGFTGKKASTDPQDSDSYQALEWPRQPDMSDEYMLGINHLYTFRDVNQKLWISKDGTPIIPIKLKEAVYEQAFFLIRSIVGIDKRDALRGQGINQVNPKAGGAEVFSNEIPICPSSKRLLSSLYCFPNGTRLSRS